MSRNWLLVTLMCLSFCIFLTSLIIPISTFVVPSVAGRPVFQQATLTLSPRGLNTAVHFELRDVAPDSDPLFGELAVKLSFHCFEIVLPRKLNCKIPHAECNFRVELPFQEGRVLVGKLNLSP